MSSAQYELLLRRLYDTERWLDPHSYARHHSFTEWRVDPFGECGYHIIEGVKERWAESQPSKE